MSDVHSVIIIGSGPAGITAAIYAARAGFKPIVITGTDPGGQLMRTSTVENWPGIISIAGHQLMHTLTQHAKHFGTQFVTDTVTGITFNQYPFIITTHKKNNFSASSIIIASGGGPKKLNCPGEKEYWGKGVTTCAVCDGILYKDMPIIIIGGGDTAMEDALFMSRFTPHISIIQGLDKLTASTVMQERVLNNKNIKIIYNSTISSIHGTGEQITHVTIINRSTQATQDLATKAVFLAIGQQPNTEFLDKQLELTNYGHIIVKPFSTNTSIDGVFACGDVTDFRYRQAITAAAGGCMAALNAQQYLKN